MNNINPAWKPMLDKLPPELHQLVIPIFQEWDKGVQEQFQKIRDEYKELEPFKEFHENNIDPEYIKQSVILADQLQREPGKIVSQINEAWNLGFVPKEEAEKLGQVASPPGGDEDDLEFDGVDISKHPEFKAMKQALDSLQGNYQSDKERLEQEEALAEFEAGLDELENSYTNPEREGGPLPFNRMFVTALISQGMDADEAVKQYHQALAISTVGDGENNTPPPNENGEEAPPVMGGGGSTGSGSPDGSIDFGKMKTNDVNKAVQDLLAQSLGNDQ
jgi:hypothetical protein